MNSLWQFVLTVLVAVALGQNSYGSNDYLAKTNGGAPFQILKPDEAHKKLVFNREARDILQSIPNNPKGIVIIGIVGAFHGGKSFLMNQLLDKTSGNGFKVGPKIDPETHGVWGWVDTNSAFADGRTVIVLDTEGFFTASSNDMYDARLFSITSLVSSILIYNTIKIIDNTQIDYLELLAKRTQLFSLKKSIMHENNYQDLDFVSFPPLYWVVRDFVQDLGSETATEWLVRNVYERRNKDFSGIVMDNSEQEEFSLTTLFNDTECFTLFYPSTDPEALKDLNSVSKYDLTREWTEDISKLKKSISDKIKRIGSSKISSGADLFNYLQVLVDVSQGKSFPAVPSVWKSYVEKLVLSSSTDAKKYFLDTLTINIGRNVYVPNDFDQMCNNLEIETINRFKSMLFGLEYIYTPHISGLEEYMMSEKNSFAKENALNAEKFCRKNMDRLKIDVKEEFLKIGLPMPRKKFDERTKSIQTKYQNLLNAAIEQYRESFPECDKCLSEFNLQLNSLIKEIEIENLNSYMEKINSAVENAVQDFKNTINSFIEMDPLPKTKDFKVKLEDAKNVAKASLSSLIEETKFDAFDPDKAKEYETQLSKDIDSECKEALRKYNKRIDEKGRILKDDAIKKYKKNMNVVYMEGPFSSSEFETTHTNAYNIAIKHFLSVMDGYYGGESEMFDNENSLKRSLDDQKIHFRKVNIDRHLEKNDAILKEVERKSKAYQQSHPFSNIESFAKKEANKALSNLENDLELKALIVNEWYSMSFSQSGGSGGSGGNGGNKGGGKGLDHNDGSSSYIKMILIVAAIAFILMIIINGAC